MTKIQILDTLLFLLIVFVCVGGRGSLGGLWTNEILATALSIHWDITEN